MSRMSRKRVWSGALCCAVALLTVPACSSDGGGGGGGDKAGGGGGNGLAGMSARKISDKAKQELLDARSVHLSMKRTGGDTTAKGGDDRDAGADADADTDAGTDDPTSLELTLDRDGNCAGTMKEAGGASLELVKRGDKVWMKPDETFWKTQVPGGDGKAAAELFKGRYLHGTTGDPMLKDVAEVCDLKELQREIQDSDDTDDAKSLHKGEPTTVDGVDVIPLTGMDDGKKNTMYIATEGKPYLVKSVERDDGGERTTTGFTDYGEPVPSKTPSPEESVDVAKLKERLRKA
ncbi:MULTISPECIES: hypothetical protein [Streptomyces]|uniref:hypothetical protein n=1 Tax=Streptomyces TaxID=1883 RepID=UPI001E4185BE|nr:MULTISPECIES: hypothetical protein [Streptomyces]UFQ17573.1 hypothetical protein J2N69_22640 [Streptomyces huasconensis]WCL87178.1 hypothetical protein PPN52_22640 [Streptomyces sp. JCM 35825]